MSRGEQDSKKSRETAKPSTPEGRKPSRELNETELDGIAGGLAEEAQKSGKESEKKSAS